MSDIVDKICNIIDEGNFHPCKRGKGSDGGAGETLEILLGLDINNSKKADTPYGEIKSFKEGVASSSKVTLFNCEPEYKHSVRKDIFEKYKYSVGRGHDACNIVMTAKDYNSHGLKIEIDEDQERLYIVDEKTGKTQNFWTLEILKERLLEKHGLGLLYVGRETITTNHSQKTHKYNSLYQYAGTNFENLIKLIQNGIIVVEFKMRFRQNHKQKFKNRGTAFRIPENKLVNLYATAERVV